MKDAVILVLLAVIAVLAAIGNDHPAVQAQIEDVSVRRADFPLCVNVNEILAQSQPYKTERQRDRTVALIRAAAGQARVTRGVRA
jgi:hypothetical protein